MASVDGVELSLKWLCGQGNGAICGGWEKVLRASVVEREDGKGWVCAPIVERD